MNPNVTDDFGLTSVEEFHTTFNHPVQDTPCIPAKERAALRINLLQEELDELKEAIENDDLVEALDAFADLQYVLAGAILEFGMQGVMRLAFDEVHRSNMSKTCKSLAQVEATQEHYRTERGMESTYSPKGLDTYIVTRVGDNKVLKSVGYSPADLASLLPTLS